MPKKLKIHSNERIDLADFEWGTATYPEGVQNLANQKIVLNGTAQVISGFRIEVADQIANPGQITIYNGSYLSSAGKLVTNEDSLFASQTVTLLGAGQTFYVELIPVDSLVDPDNRGIWDPTFNNGVGNPPGKEFIDLVTTRVDTVWAVKTPISTSAFSTGVPLAKLTLDAFGRITTAVNPGMVLGPFTTTLSAAALAGATSFSVLDATLLPGGGSTVTIGSETKTINTIDYVGNSFTTTAGLVTGVPAGTIVKGDLTKQFITQKVALTGSSPDVAQRLFKADESRGLVLTSSKYSANTRDDLEIKSLKDHVDFLAGQIREMKVGNTSMNPLWPATSRYFDYTGSLAGSKIVTYTIGNGSTSIGDFNGTSEVPFQTAIDTAVANGATTVVLHAKSGTYTFTTAVTSAVTLIVRGDSRVSTIIQGDAGTLPPLFSITGAFTELYVFDLQLLCSQLSSNFCVLNADANNCTIHVERITANTAGNLLGATGTNLTTCKIYNSSITVRGTASAIRGTTNLGAVSLTATISSSNFVVQDTAMVVTGHAVRLSWNTSLVTKTGASNTILSVFNLLVSEVVNVQVTSTPSTDLSVFFNLGIVSAVALRNVFVTAVTTGTNRSVGFHSAGGSDLTFTNCAMRTVTTPSGPIHIGVLTDTATMTNLLVDSCRFSCEQGFAFRSDTSLVNFVFTNNRVFSDSGAVSVPAGVASVEGALIKSNIFSMSENIISVNAMISIGANTQSNIIVDSNTAKLLSMGFVSCSCTASADTSIQITNNQIIENPAIVSSNDVNAVSLTRFQDAIINNNSVIGSNIGDSGSVRHGIDLYDVRRTSINSNNVLWTSTGVSGSAKSNIHITNSSGTDNCSVNINGNTINGTKGGSEVAVSSVGIGTTYVNVVGNVLHITSPSTLGANLTGTATYNTSDASVVATNFLVQL